MKVDLTPEQEAQLSQIASTTGRAINALAQEAIARYLEDTRFAEAVQLGEAQLERGQYLTHEDVGARLDQLLRS
jgi:predicted transcriptional regulator